jgi:hypothetical protein
MTITEMIEMLPEEDQKLIFEIVRKFVLAWDPMMTKVKAIEEERDRVAWELMNKAGEDWEKWDKRLKALEDSALVPVEEI